MRRLIYFLLFVCGTTTSLRAQEPQEPHNFQTTKALDIFNALYRNLDLYYVDTLNAEQQVEEAIDYMLDRLDPYTEFYKAGRTDELRLITTGKYAGIGSPIRYHKRSDRCAFEAPYLNMPAWQAGIRSGDIIMRIDNKDVGVCGKTDRRVYSQKISTLLRGNPGTTFTVTVKRPGRERLLRFRITRQTIKQPSVVYTTLLPNQVGYVLLSSFTEDTAKDLREAFEQLRKQGAKRLVFDLRGNGGGLMGEAVKVVNFFVPKGKRVLSTRGKDPEMNESYKTTGSPFDTGIPLAVLVNYGTASSAEITSGCLQDYDRAVIVGRRTYGKGLVQTPKNLPYGAMMKLTTAKYYIPSGRCIQAYDFKNRGADGQPRHLPDSLCKTFRTAHGRPVKDGGGITPDIVVEEDSLPDLIAYLESSEQLFDYVTGYCNARKTIAPPSEFKLSDQDFEAFKQYMFKSDFTYDSRTRQALDRVKQWAKFEGYDERAAKEFEALAAKLRPNLQADFERWQQPVRTVVESAIINNIYGRAGVVAYRLRNDKDLNAAVDVLNDRARYDAILRP